MDQVMTDDKDPLKIRSIHQRYFEEKSVLKNFALFTEKCLRCSLL